MRHPHQARMAAAPGLHCRAPPRMRTGILRATPVLHDHLLSPRRPWRPLHHRLLLRRLLHPSPMLAGRTRQPPLRQLNLRRGRSPFPRLPLSVEPSPLRDSAALHRAATPEPRAGVYIRSLLPAVTGRPTTQVDATSTAAHVPWPGHPILGRNAACAPRTQTPCSCSYIAVCCCPRAHCPAARLPVACCAAQHLLTDADLHSFFAALDG